jgi:hypothetical protein
MEQSLQQYYEEQFSLFSQQGWKDLTEDLQKLRDSIDDLSAVKDSNDLWYRKGQLDILDLIIDRKKMCEKVFEELQHAENI